MDSQQNMITPIKGGHGGWKTKIQNKNHFFDLIKKAQIRYETMPQEFLTLFKEFNYFEFIKLLDQSSSDIQILQQNKEQKKRNIDALPESIRKNLFKFQTTGVEFGIQRNCRLLIGDEMGVGKTLQALCIAYIYRDEWPLLIICPSCLRYTIKQEIINWFSEQINESLIQVISKGSDHLLVKSEIVIISFDMVNSLYETIKLKKFQTCIIDEAHYLKSLDSQRSKIIVPLVAKMKNVILLTGTPALSKPRELFNILKIIRPDVFKEFKTFGHRYCNPQLNKIINCINYEGCDNELELNFILQERIMIRRLKEEILPDLPPKRRKKVLIEIPQGSKNKIKKAVNKSNDKLLKNYVNKQMESQYIDHEFPNQEDQENQDEIKKTFNFVYQETGLAKLDAVKEYLEDLMDSQVKLIIFAHHQQVLDQIEKMVKFDFKRQFIRIDGNVKQEERVELVKQFQTLPHITVAVLSLQAASHGITLTASSHVIFAELYPTPAVMLQAEDRSHRINQSSNVLCHYLIGKDTIDEDIFNMLMQKYLVTSSILDGQRKNLQIDEFQFFEYNQEKIEDEGDEINLQDDQKEQILQATNTLDIKEVELDDEIELNNKENKKFLLNQNQLVSQPNEDTVFRDRTNQNNQQLIQNYQNSNQVQIKIKQEDISINKDKANLQFEQQPYVLKETSNGIILDILDDNTEISIQMLNQLFNQSDSGLQQQNKEENFPIQKITTENYFLNDQIQKQEDQLQAFQHIFDAIDEIENDSEIQKLDNWENIIPMKIEQKREMENVKDYFQSQSDDSYLEGNDGESSDQSSSQDSLEKEDFQGQQSSNQSIELFAFKRKLSQNTINSIENQSNTEDYQQKYLDSDNNKSKLSYFISSDNQKIEIEPFQSQIQSFNTISGKVSQKKDFILSNNPLSNTQPNNYFESLNYFFEINQNSKERQINLKPDANNGEQNRNLTSISSNNQIDIGDHQNQKNKNEIYQPGLEFQGLSKVEQQNKYILQKNEIEKKLRNCNLAPSKLENSTKEYNNLNPTQSILINNTCNQLQNMPSVRLDNKQPSLGINVAQENDPLSQEKMKDLSSDDKQTKQTKIDLQNSYSYQQQCLRSTKIENLNIQIQNEKQEYAQNQQNKLDLEIQIKKNEINNQQELNEQNNLQSIRSQNDLQNQGVSSSNINITNQIQKINSQLNIIYADTDDSSSGDDESDDDKNFEIQLAQKFNKQTKQEIYQQAQINDNPKQSNQTPSLDTENNNSDIKTKLSRKQNVDLQLKNSTGIPQQENKFKIIIPSQLQKIDSNQKTQQQNYVSLESREIEQKNQQKLIKLEDHQNNKFCYNQSTQGKVESSLQKNNLNINNQTQIDQKPSFMSQTYEQSQQKRKREQFESQRFSSQSNSDLLVEEDILKLQQKQLQTRRK